MNNTLPAPRTVLLAGSSGLVGREILKLLLADDTVAQVHSVGRRAVALEHAKLTQHTVDFSALPALPPIDAAFIALGTTIKVAGSQQAFRAVDYEAVVAVARAARTAGATRLGVVSAMGADPKSTLFYNRIKGETEQSLKGLGFTTLVIARPSFLAGDREALGQPLRSGEKLALNISRKLAFLIPPNLKSIDVRKVARAMLSGVSAGAKGTRVMLSGEMQRIQRACWCHHQKPDGG
ncbi:NAD(P)H-binding protein [soil metagenome]